MIQCCVASSMIQNCHRWVYICETVWPLSWYKGLRHRRTERMCILVEAGLLGRAVSTWSIAFLSLGQTLRNTEIQKYTITQMHSCTLVEIGVTIWSIELLPISMNGFATCVKTKHTWILCVTKWLKRLTNQQEMAPLKSLGSHCFGAGDSILVRIVLILLRLVRHCSTGVLHCCQLVHIVLVFAVPCKPLLWRGTD